MSGSVDDLTEGQKECLRLFYQRFDAKEIGRRLGISPATVHQRLTAARRILAVARSMEAARLLADAEGRAALYDPVLYDEIDVADPADRQPRSWLSRLPWPLPTRGRPSNDMDIMGRLIAILGLATVFMAATAFYLIAIRWVSDTF